MDRQQRRALRILPKAIQDLADKAIQGSTTDVQKLYESIRSDTEPNTFRLSVLLPVFYPHLDPALIPRLNKAKYTADERGAIHRARWALKAVGRIHDRIPPEEGDSALWERMFPWMSFLQTKFLHPDPSRDERLGMSFPDGDIARMVVQDFSVMCHSGELNLRMVLSMPSATHLIAELWLFVAHQRVDYGDLQGPHAQKVAMLLQSTIMLTTFCINCPEVPEGISTLLHAAGTIHRVLATAVQYVRLIADTVCRIKDPTPDNMAVVEVAASTLAECISFIKSFERCDPAHSHAIMALGSVHLVTTATRHIARLLLADVHGPGRALRTRNTPTHRKIFTQVYQYLHFALFLLGDGITPTCHALDAGILEAIFRTWLYTSSTSTHANPPPKFAENEAIIVLWRALPCYLVYPRVLRTFACALRRPAFRKIEQFARHDDDLWGLWKTLRATIQEYLVECREELDGSWGGLYERRCAAKNASEVCAHHDDGSESGTESESDGETVYHHCAECQARMYCSKACQRADWKAGHRTGCKILHDGLGTLTSSIFRRSLPLIGEIEEIEFMLHHHRINDLFEEQFRAYRDYPNHLAIEIDLVNYPRNITVVPLNIERYLRLAVNSGWSLQRAREEWEGSLAKIRAHQPQAEDNLEPCCGNISFFWKAEATMSSDW
ncbi:hypothetical protein BJ138DRAFT_1105305 [Hygrophoropsis aurantiaca]|uniref:Uncharacterized protein n=1 Tax=Hygrophoropsis aurantiaca TaxID=72124 RepID=A0ACB8A014_9AGAM|nr:hypothetical protein BJ138DRAFT_1105305 [Hygrophoropsis aurantiaca]